jgi:hypothetical protein
MDTTRENISNASNNSDVYSLNLSDEALPASSDSIMKAMTGAFRKIDFDYSDAPRATRGSNEPPPKIEGLDENRNIEHWKKKSPAYIMKQLRLRGWRAPGNVDIKDAPKDKYHLVYIDPPYDFSNQAVEDVLSALHDYEFLNSDAFIAVERTTRGAQFIWPDAFAPARERKYGQATIYYANYQP